LFFRNGLWNPRKLTKSGSALHKILN